MLYACLGRCLQIAKHFYLTIWKMVSGKQECRSVKNGLPFVRYPKEESQSAQVVLFSFSPDLR
jgi:hypothetical protein